jgi:hypothetical protein
MDDDGHIPDHALCHAAVRMDLGALLTLSIAADRLHVLYHQSRGFLCGDDESGVSGVDGPGVFCLALGVQSVHRVGLLEFYGRSLYNGTGCAIVRGDRGRGSSGALLGPLFTTGLTFLFPIPVLMLASSLFLIACLGCIYRLDRWGRTQSAHHQAQQGDPLRGSFLAGVRLTFSSPYLLGICGYLSLLTVTATFLYLEQTRLVSEYLDQPEARTRLFSSLDFMTSLFTWLTQMFITNRVISRFGLVAPLLFLPLVSLAGFVGIALWPTLALYVVFSVMRRVGEYALSKPAREVLFTVVSREEKYKAKNFIDTAISRAATRRRPGW